MRFPGIRSLLLSLMGLLPIATISTLEAQSSCPQGVRLEGNIVDPTGAAIPGARVSWSRGNSTTSDSLGHYVFSCIPRGNGTLTATAQGFAALTRPTVVRAGEEMQLNLTLALDTVQTNVQVNANTGPEAGESNGTLTLTTQQVQQLPDDPDDFLTQLQTLAAQFGGDPANARILVDGFQNTSALPPKGSIASIRINPDFFSAEYAWPPYGGGLIEITTKPGTSTLHGSLFFTGSPGAVNATDPFSLSPTPASRVRYGFTLSDALIPRRADLTLALENRRINEFNIVNAQTLGTDGAAAPLQQTVTAPQRLWIASARNGWQLLSNDSGFISFSANVNQTGNQGVGGLVLGEAGYTSLISEYGLRISNTATFGSRWLHETRLGYSWKRTEDMPNSTAASMQVAGYFTGGGAVVQHRNDRERDLEVDDDAMMTRGRDTLKFGVQALGFFVHDFNPNTFNGEFVFGGGSAPVLDSNNNPTGQVTTITSLEQYRRALANLPGGAPTTYQVTTGQPLVTFLQWNVALFGEDTVRLTPRFTVAAGLRYQMQTAPTALLSFNPRVGFDWSLNQQSTWILHGHAGFFGWPNTVQDINDGFRLNGVRQTQHNVYSPNFNSPLVPVAGSIATTTIEEFAPSMKEKWTFNLYLALNHDFPGHWHTGLHYYLGEDAYRLMQRNINAPIVASNNNTAPDPTAALLAPRPLTPNENILQYQNNGHLNGDLISVTVDQHESKHFGLSFYYRHAHFKSDSGDSPLTQPQSSYSDRGESSRADWLRTDAGSLIGNVKLPWRLDGDVQLNASTGGTFNIITGTDDNGDGDFNDRPAYAIAPGPGVYNTRYGLLSANAINGDVPRNAGTMPGVIRLALNLNRTFLLNPRNKDNQRTLSFNARAANLLNHTNVTEVNPVLSTTLGQPTVAEPARRIEFGANFAF